MTISVARILDNVCINLIRSLDVNVTLSSEFIHPIRASIHEAQLRIDAPILRYCFQGCRKLKRPCAGSHLTKLAYSNNIILVTLQIYKTEGNLKFINIYKIYLMYTKLK